MKTTLKGLTIAILFFVNLSSFVYGQGNSNAQRTIYLFEGESVRKVIVFPIKEQTKFFSLPITAGVSEGEITVEIYDPSGERVKKISAGLQSNPDKRVKSTMAFLPFKNPMKGDWDIRITAKDAMGSVVVDLPPWVYSEIQPSKTMTGTITYKGTKPFWGAIVLVKGTTIGTKTDKSGNFSLKIPVNAESLIFYSEGMKKQEVKIGEQTRFNIDLNE